MNDLDHIPPHLRAMIRVSRGKAASGHVMLADLVTLGYRTDPDPEATRSWTPPARMEDMVERAERVDRFTVTEDHLTLLAHANVWWIWAEFGAPGINPKRPYGNSDVLHDIAEYLPHLADDEQAMERVHAETVVALQIALITRSFRPGTYERTPYRYGSWLLVSPSPLPGGEEK